MAKSKKPTSTKSETALHKEPRKLRAPQYKPFKLQKPIKHPGPKLPGVFSILVRSLKVLKQHARLFGGIAAMYALLTVVFVQGLGLGADLSELQDSLNKAVGKEFGSVGVAVALYGVLLEKMGTQAGQAGGAYQSVILLISSLALIWALRQAYSVGKKRIRVKDAFYKSTHPIIPFVLVFCVVMLQLLPLLMGGALYALVINNGIAVLMIEKVLWGLLSALLILVSLYMVSSSLFALYIVTLPDMTPMKALRSARELVRYRRWTVLRKVVFLPIMLFCVSLGLTVPLIIVLPGLVGVVFFLVGVAALPVAHSYMYALYRELM